ELAHFAKNKNQENVLVSYGYGVEHQIEAILTESEVPLHYSEIARTINNRCGKQVDIRRVHNAAAEVGILLGRGIYGLRKHFPLTESESELVIKVVENLIENGPADRQWHCSGIYEELEKLDLEFIDRLTPYIINLVLLSSQKLNSL